MTSIIDHDNGVLSPTVKNTFIDLCFTPAHTAERRSSSAPPSPDCKSRRSAPFTRFSHEGFGSKHREGTPTLDSDLSTDAHTDASNEAEVRSVEECSTGDSSPPPAIVDDELLWIQEWGPPPPEEMCAPCTVIQGSWPMTEAPAFCQVFSTTPESQSHSRRLNSKAASYKLEGNAFKLPVTPDGDDIAREHYKYHFAEVINYARDIVQKSGHASQVEVSHDDNRLTMLIRARTSASQDEYETERLLTIAKEALLDAAAQSKCIYLMGYCSPKPFTMQPQGFETMLGAMDNPTTACWHVFKKGFCRHAADCCKDHPACQMPVHVLVEGVQLRSENPHVVTEFKLELGDLVRSVAGALNSCPCTKRTEVSKDMDCQGWTIEVTVVGALNDHKEYLLTLAKSSLFDATNNSKNIYILGYATKPFVTKSQGFVTMLGDMPDERKACWDLYSKGCCSRDGACRWQHPQCVMPVNIVIKDGFQEDSVLCGFDGYQTLHV